MPIEIPETPSRLGVHALRRSVAAHVFPSPLATPLPDNDDDGERRDARRRTLISSMDSVETSESIDKCLEVAHTKLNRENAWQLSLIDMVSKMLERHHSKFKNLMVAGSTLEASAKVYGMRVDSLHQDILRMAAGLSDKDSNNQQRKGTDNQEAESQNANPNSETQGGEPKKRKRVKKPMSTVTRNRDTINARIETMPTIDPIFAKLNSTLSSINASNRLMNNVLPTSESKLLLHWNVPWWSKPCPAEKDYQMTVLPKDNKNFDSTRFFEIHFDNYQLRPILPGYLITEAPLRFDVKDASLDDAELMPPPPPPVGIVHQNGEQNDDAFAVAFNIHGDYTVDEPDDNNMQADVDFEDLGELTADERQAINNCRNLRVPRVHLENMCPTDSNIRLEYSYRPLDRYSHFWAGPAHWKYKNPRPSQIKPRASTQVVHHRARVDKRRQPIEFKDQAFYDQVFLPLTKLKVRKSNPARKWDPKKLKLPIDLKLDPNIFFKFETAPGVPVEMEIETQSVTTSDPNDAEKPTDDDDEEALGFAPLENHFGEDIPLTMEPDATQSEIPCLSATQDQTSQAFNISNDSAFEIATSFEGAPEAVAKIDLPFAKRAKVIDMKNLKRSCYKVIDTKLTKSTSANKEPLIEETLPVEENEIYAPGAATLNEVLEDMPKLLTLAMQESVSFSVALYSVLHLANENNFHIFGSEDHTDAIIRRVDRIDTNNNNNAKKPPKPHGATEKNLA